MDSATADSISWTTHVVPALVPIVLGAIGYVGSRFVAEWVGFFWSGLEARKTNRAAIAQRMEAVAFEIRDLACRYWLSEVGHGDRDRLIASIMGRMYFLGELTVELFGQRPDACRDIQVRLNRFDEKCTGGNFGGAACQPDPNRAREIELASYVFVHGVGLNSRKER